MTKLRALGLRVVAVILPVVLTLIVPEALAQQSGDGQRSANSSAAVGVHGTNGPSRAWQQAGIPVTSPPEIPLHGSKKKRAASKEDSGAVSFEPPVIYGSGGSVDQGVVVADVNGDGKADIVVSSYSGVVGVLLGNGDGTFQPVVTYETGGSTEYALTVADVNGDGKPDIIATSCAAAGKGCGSADGAVSVLLGNGDGTFQPAVVYDTGAIKASAVSVADVNGDGIPDLVVTNWYGEANGDGTVGVLLGNGDGTFQKAVIYDSGGPEANGQAVADVNRDGIPDVVVVNYFSAGSGEGSVGVLIGNGDGTFQPAVTYLTGGDQASGIALGDVNNDGYPDVIVGNLGSPTVGVLLNAGNGQFGPATTYSSLGGLNVVAVGDLNRDGNLDIIAPTNSDVVAVLLGNGDGTFQAAIGFPIGGSDCNTVAVGDVNGDGQLDVVTTIGFSNQVSVLINNTGPALPPTTTTLASSLNPSSSGQSITFTAAVTSSSDTPTGVVIFYGGYGGLTEISRATLSNGSASASISSLLPGWNLIAAAYQGSDDVAPSTSGVLVQIVNGTTSETSLNSSLNPSTYGQLVTFAGTVMSSSGTPTGTVIFYDGMTAIENTILANGGASFSTSSLPAGADSIRMAYQGFGPFSRSTSPAVNQVVNVAKTTTALAPSVNPVPVGQHVTYAATITSQYGGALTGTITFQDNGVTVATVGVSNNQATFTTKYKKAGLQLMTATYSGDSNNLGSTSYLMEDAGKVPYATKTALTTSGSPSVVGQPVTFTATVASEDGTIPDGGTVAFYAGSEEIGTGTTSGGVATFTTSSLAAKTYTIKAVYSGDATFKESHGTVRQVVTKSETD